jgi:Zn-dependent protease with chaperone function
LTDGLRFNLMHKQRWAAILLLFSIFALQLSCGRGSKNAGVARERFKPGFNLFKPEQDIELGRQSAQEIARQVPLLNDEPTVSYIQQLGAKLASKASGYKFPYQFAVVGTKDINAFALPGGFIFVNAGTITAVKNEGELAGVIAHEIAHVALRHGTSQASKAYLAKAGLDILSGIAGGRNTDLGQVVESIGGAGANAIFLKFGRTAETQADIEGARMMAESGYDPRDMVSFFKTLEEQGGQRVPEFLSDHPNPGNRAALINDILPSLPVSPNPIRITEQFNQIKARLSNRSALASSKEPARLGPRDPNANKSSTRPEPPSATFTSFEAPDGSFSLEYPENWDALVGDDSNMIVAPKGGYGQAEQNVVVTHGSFIGAIPAQASDLETANSQFVRQQIEANPDFRVMKQPQAINFGGRQGFATIVAGPSTITGVVEIDVIYTTATSDGRLFYLVTIAPEDEYESYKAIFERIISSIRLSK